MKSLLRRIAERIDRDEQHGLAVVWFVLTIGIFLVMAAFAVDLVHAYAEQQAAQKTADAAALAGAAEIPNDPSGGASPGGLAQTKAVELAQDNGWVSTGTNVDTIGPVTVNANTMTVTVTRRFNTFFGGFIGFHTLTVKKTATAIYDGPVQMGSPANNLGDVPECPPGASSPCVNPPANASQNLFAQIEGPRTVKQAGNANSTGYCNGDVTVDGCKQGAGAGFGKPPQLEYDSSGENIIVHNDGGLAQLWIYDAPMVGTNADCQLPLQSALLHDPAGVTGWPDNVYNNYGGGPAATPSQFSHCAGDIDLSIGGSQAGSTPVQTTYSLNLHDNDQDPGNNTTQSPGCGHTYTGYKDPNVAWTSGDPDVRATWHQWAMLCTFTDSGDLVLRVSGDTNGEGMNSFAVLAIRPGGGTSGLTVSTTKALPLFAHTPVSAGGSTTQFYIARVLPSPGRDRTLNLEFFDFGDELVGGTSSGQIDFAWENVNHPSNLKHCQWQPPPPNGANGRDDPLNPATLTLNQSNPYGGTDADSCSFHYDKSQWNGRWVVITIPIPGTDHPGSPAYSCDQSSTQNCWLKLKVTPTGGNLGDATTWNATMGGSPVALLH